MKFRVPHTYVIIFALLVLCAVATWFVPGGQYVQSPEGLSYEEVPSVPQSWQVFTAIYHGFVKQAGIIVFILVVGGAFWLLNATGAVSAGIGRFIARVGHRDKWVLVGITLLFSLAGAIFGMSEETYYRGEDRTGELYRELLQVFEKKLKFLVNLGYTNVNIKGLYWMQGENDRERPEEYKEAFVCFASDLRRDLADIVKSLTGGDDRGAADMPILVGTISKTQNLAYEDSQEKNEAFIEMQKSLPNLVKNCYIIDNSEYEISQYNGTKTPTTGSKNGLGYDQWHWNQTDQLEIGYNVGEKFLDLGGLK